MKKIFYLVGIIVTFITGCFLNKKYNWGIGNFIAGKVQLAADYMAEKLEKTRGKSTEDTGDNETSETSAS